MEQNQRLISHLGGAVVFLFEKTFIENESGEAFQSTESTYNNNNNKNTHTHTCKLTQPIQSTIQSTLSFFGKSDAEKKSSS